MASAYRCDRCGRFYETNDKYSLNDYKNNETMIGIKFVSHRWSDNRIDLCDDCIGKMRKFLNMKEDKD